eukprot:jgi/Galph1/4507/GphlegSOOS_G3197.1
MLSWWLIVVGLLSGLILSSYLYGKRISVSNNKYPPVCGGLPFLGCAVEFGKNPLNFLQKCKEKYGDIFTLQLPGRRMTFIFASPMELRKSFFNSSSERISFTAGVEPFTCRIFGMSKRDFALAHKTLLTTLRSELGAKHMPQLARGLVNRYYYLFQNHWGKHNEKDALKLLTQTLEDTSLRVVFGNDFAEASPTLLEDFVDFDEWFELAATPVLPHFLLRPFVESRKRLLRTIASNYKLAKNAPIYKLVEAYGNEGNVPSLLLTSLWATWSNASSATFWTLVYILADEKVEKNVLKEVEKAVPSLLNDDIELNVDWIYTNLSYVAYCVSETLRLTASVVDIRKVMKDTPCGRFIVRKGDYLCISPASAHREPSIFHDGNKFNPERFLSKEKVHPNSLFDKELVTFGGGFYKCPGQLFAMVEIILFTAMVFHIYDLKLLDSLPELKETQTVGIKKPSCSCKISYRWKDRSCVPRS